MDKIISFILLVFVSISQGCATAGDNRKLLQTRTMEQAVERNDIVLSDWCSRVRVKAIMAAKYEAIQNKEPAKNWSKFYRAPVCVLNERNTWRRKQAVIPREFGFTLADLAKLDYDELCEKSPLKRMGTSRGMVWLAEQGIPTEFYNSISEECIRRDNQKTLRRVRWNSLFYRIAPRVGYGYGFGYGNYEYRSSGYYSRTGRYGGTVSGGCEFCGPRRRALIKRATGR